MCPIVPLRCPTIFFNKSVCVCANGHLGVRKRLFGYTQTVVWAYANGNNLPRNSLLSAPFLPAIGPLSSRLKPLRIKSWSGFALKIEAKIKTKYRKIDSSHPCLFNFPDNFLLILSRRRLKAPAVLSSSPKPLMIRNWSGFALSCAEGDHKPPVISILLT